MYTVFRYGCGVPIAEDTYAAFDDLGEVLDVSADGASAETDETGEEPVEVDWGVDCECLEGAAGVGSGWEFVFRDWLVLVRWGVNLWCGRGGWGGRDIRKAFLRVVQDLGYFLLRGRSRNVRFAGGGGNILRFRFLVRRVPRVS